MSAPVKCACGRGYSGKRFEEDEAGHHCVGSIIVYAWDKTKTCGKEKQGRDYATTVDEQRTTIGDVEQYETDKAADKANDLFEEIVEKGVLAKTLSPAKGRRVGLNGLVAVHLGDEEQIADDIRLSNC